MRHEATLIVCWIEDDLIHFQWHLGPRLEMFEITNLPRNVPSHNSFYILLLSRQWEARFLQLSRLGWAFCPYFCFRGISLESNVGGRSREPMKWGNWPGVPCQFGSTLPRISGPDPALQGGPERKKSSWVAAKNDTAGERFPNIYPCLFLFVCILNRFLRRCCYCWEHVVICCCPPSFFSSCLTAVTTSIMCS